jgi:antitoxin ParD1/3/4
MNVTLPPELESFVRYKMANGPYRDVGEVICEALSALRERDEHYMQKLADLRREIDIGIAEIERGAVAPFTDATLELIKIRARRLSQSP